MIQVLKKKAETSGKSWNDNECKEIVANRRKPEQYFLKRCQKIEKNMHDVEEKYSMANRKRNRVRFMHLMNYLKKIADT